MKQQQKIKFCKLCNVRLERSKYKSDYNFNTARFCSPAHRKHYSYLIKHKKKLDAVANNTDTFKHEGARA